MLFVVSYLEVGYDVPEEAHHEMQEGLCDVVVELALVFLPHVLYLLVHERTAPVQQTQNELIHTYCPVLIARQSDLRRLRR